MSLVSPVLLKKILKILRKKTERVKFEGKVLTSISLRNLKEK